MLDVDIQLMVAKRTTAERHLGFQPQTVAPWFEWKNFSQISSTRGLLTLALDFCQSPQPHARQPDEAFRVRLLITARFFEARNFRVV